MPLGVELEWEKGVVTELLEVLNNSLSLNKENHERDGIGYLILIRIIFYDFIVRCFLIFSFIEKIYQILKTVFDDVYKHLDVRQNSPLRVVF